MRIFVTGGAGYVGSALVMHLASRGHDVTVLDLVPIGAECLLPGILGGRVSLIRGDVTDERVLERTIPGHDAVVHLAAVVGEAACDVDPSRSAAINVGGAEAVAIAAATAGITRVVSASTCSNYGVSDPGVLATEDDPLRPLGLYAETKVTAEGLVRKALPHATILRFGTVCGASPRMRFDLLVSELAREAVLGNELVIYAPDAWRPYLPITELVRAVEEVIVGEPARVAGATFNVVAENCTKRDLIAVALRHFPSAQISLVAKTPDLRDYRVSGERFEAATGFQMQSTVADAFAETVRLLELGTWPNAGARRLTAVIPNRSQE